MIDDSQEGPFEVGYVFVSRETVDKHDLAPVRYLDGGGGDYRDVEHFNGIREGFALELSTVAKFPTIARFAEEVREPVPRCDRIVVRIIVGLNNNRMVSIQYRQ